MDKPSRIPQFPDFFHGMTDCHYFLARQRLGGRRKNNSTVLVSVISRMAGIDTPGRPVFDNPTNNAEDAENAERTHRISDA